MVKTFLSFTLIFSLAMLTALPDVSFAQKATNTEKVSGPKKQLSTIVFAGVAGAILGLSTLSFYGRPQDKLSNIAVGFAIGVISGAIYTTYKAASQPRDFYRDSQLMMEEERDKELRYYQGHPPIKADFALLTF
jgi:hypothetical protein